MKSDPDVTFVLVSLDDDPKRLERYLQDQALEMPIARMSREDAAERFGVTDTPTTFYLDREGVIQYEARGTEVHGDATERVTWFVRELQSR